MTRSKEADGELLRRLYVIICVIVKPFGAVSTAERFTEVITLNNITAKCFQAGNFL